MKHFKSFAMILAAFLFTAPVMAQTPPPSDWKEMEVEAKWSASRNAIERIISDMANNQRPFGHSPYRIISDMANGQTVFGFDARVRWSGIPRKFVDHYYDDAAGSLSKDLHSLRHRTRYTSAPLADDRNLSSVLNATWNKDWERIQYKSTPLRIGPVWFRKETGDCRIWDQDGDDPCPSLPTTVAADIIQDPAVSHEAMTALMADHPGLQRPGLQPYLVVTDFRYRVILSLNGEKAFEISLDELISQNLITGAVTHEYEAELEVIADTPTDETLQELFRVSDLMQARYELTPSDSSKGGNKVPEL